MIFFKHLPLYMATFATIFSLNKSKLLLTGEFLSC